MPTPTAVSTDVNTLLGAANFAAFRTSLGLTALATTTPGTGVATALTFDVNNASGLAPCTAPSFVTSATVLGSSTNFKVESIAGTGAFAATTPQITFGSSASLRVTASYGLTVCNAGGTAEAHLRAASFNSAGSISAATYVADINTRWELACNGWRSPTGLRLVSGGAVVWATSSTNAGGGDGNFIRSGTGSPESAVTAPVGSLWLRTDGGTSTTLYVKESGSGNTGWVAK